MYRVLGYGTVYCTQSGGPHIFSKHKSNMYTFVQPRGCLYFPLKHKSAMYTFVQETQITKVCTNVHTCMYICHLAPRPTSTFWICADNFESGQFFSEKNRKFYINSVKNM